MPEDFVEGRKESFGEIKSRWMRSLSGGVVAGGWWAGGVDWTSIAKLPPHWCWALSHFICPHISLHKGMQNCLKMQRKFFEEISASCLQHIGTISVPAASRSVEVVWWGDRRRLDWFHSEMVTWAPERRKERARNNQRVYQEVLLSLSIWCRTWSFSQKQSQFAKEFF